MLLKGLIVAVLVAAWACGARSAPDPIDLAAEAIDTSVTPDRWLSTHPGDSIGVRGERWSWSPHHENCRTAISHQTHGSLSMRRVALFIVPHPPADFAFDADTARLAERRCELHSIRFSIAAKSDTVAKRIADSLSRVIEARLGVPGATPSPDPNAWPAVSAKAWTRLGVTTVVRAEADRSGPNASIVGWRTVVEGYTDKGDYAVNPVSASRDSIRPRSSGTAWLFLDSLLVDAAVPETRNVATELARLAPNGKLPTDRTAVDSVALPALRALLSNWRARPSSRQAAALLAAHVLVTSVAGAFSAHVLPSTGKTAVDDERRMRAYERTGASYDVDPPGLDDLTMVYTENWLAPAYHADSLSFAGRRAFALILGAGGQIGPGCSRTDEYQKIIELGEPALRDHAADSTYVHHMLSLAYPDVVSMAMGFDTGTVYATQMGERYEGYYSDETHAIDLRPIQAQAPEARRRGYAHARASLALLHDPVDRAAMWHLMFRMLAGIPGRISFACMGE